MEMTQVVLLVGAVTPIVSAVMGYMAARMRILAERPRLEASLAERLDQRSERIQRDLWRELDFYGDLVEYLSKSVDDLQEYVDRLTGIMRSHEIEVPPPPVFRTRPRRYAPDELSPREQRFLNRGASGEG